MTLSLLINFDVRGLTPWLREPFGICQTRQAGRKTANFSERGMPMQVMCDRCTALECICGDPAVEAWIAEQEPELEAVCANCGSRYGEHRHSDDACPTERWFSETQKFVEARCPAKVSVLLPYDSSPGQIVLQCQLSESECDGDHAFEHIEGARYSEVRHA